MMDLLLQLTCDLLDERLDLSGADRGLPAIRHVLMIVNGFVRDGPSIGRSDDIMQLSINN